MGYLGVGVAALDDEAGDDPVERLPVSWGRAGLGVRAGVRVGVRLRLRVRATA